MSHPAAADHWDVLERSARRRAEAGLRRQLRPRSPADGRLDLAGNDYLGLSRHPAVLAAATAAMAEYGLGATGSRLVRGSTEVHERFEAELAGWLGGEAVLLHSSGYLANLSAVRALTAPGTVLVCDAHNHASLVDGCRLAGADRRTSTTVVTPHADVAAVRAALAGHAGRPAVVVTESVFSVDGDLAPLPALHAACREHGALLLVDEAHAVGLLGPRGAGAVAAAGLAGERDVVVTATLSKAFGALGGLLAGPALLRDHVVDTGRAFVYDTALPPAVVAGAAAALVLIRTGDGLRAELADRARLATTRLREAGLSVVEPAGGVLSVRAADSEAALRWAERCRTAGVAVGCFRPPSTPDRQSRIRLTVNAALPRDAFERALDIVLAARP